MDSFYSSSAAEASAVASDGPAYVDEIVATNSGAVVLYLHVFDSATVPADTTAPDICIAVPGTSTVSWDPDFPAYFSAGVSVCLSSTAATKTVAGAVGVFTVRGKVA